MNINNLIRGFAYNRVFIDDRPVDKVEVKNKVTIWMDGDYIIFNQQQLINARYDSDYLSAFIQDSNNKCRKVNFYEEKENFLKPIKIITCDDISNVDPKDIPSDVEEEFGGQFGACAGTDG